VPLAMIVWAARLLGAQPVPGMTFSAVRGALGDRLMRGGMWLMALPAIGFGVVNTLVPLRLDELGAGATVIAAAFLVAVALEAAISPVAGRVADRRGAIFPTRIGLAAGGVAVALLPVGGTVPLVAACVAFVAPTLGMIWTPAMALLSTGAQERGLDAAFGFGLSNMAWGIGAAAGAAGGGALAEATADAVPLLLLALLCVGTAVAMRQISSRPALQEA
jgi:MFS family permease